MNTTLQTKGSKPRVDFIDLAKGLCIILVVYEHIHNIGAAFPYSAWIDSILASFRMPLYFILSGLFFKQYEGFCGFAYRKINKLLIPFLFWYIVTSITIPYILKLCGFHLKHLGETYLDSILFFWHGGTYSNGTNWFLLCLFWTNIIFYVLMLLSKKMPKQTLSLALLSMIGGCIGYVMAKTHYLLPAYLSPAFTVLPFFFFGYYIYRKSNILLPNKYDKYNLLFAFACFLFICLVAEPIELVRNKVGSFFSLYTCGIIGTMFILYLAKTLHHLPGISYWGRFSIIILVTHLYIIKITGPIVKLLHINNNIINSIICLILTMLSYYLVIPLIKTYMPHVTAQKDVIPIKKTDNTSM